MKTTEEKNPPEDFYYEIKIGRAIFSELSRNQNKEYVAGFLMGRAKVVITSDKKEVNK